MWSKYPLCQKETHPDVLPFMTSCTRGGKFPSSKCIYSNTALRSNVKRFSFIYFFLSLKVSILDHFQHFTTTKRNSVIWKKTKRMWQLWLLLRWKFHERSFKNSTAFILVIGLHFRLLFLPKRTTEGAYKGWEQTCKWKPWFYFDLLSLR